MYMRVYVYIFCCCCFRFSEAPDDHHDPEPVPDVNNALEHYPQSARHEKITDFYYNPGIRYVRYYYC